MRINTVAMRILIQLKHDKRTMALILFAPLLVMALVYSIIGDNFFDNFGGMIIGIIVFFFVFVVAGINFLSERVSGTLEKMLSTPIRCIEIVLGYIVGFGILTLIQTSLITLFSVYVLGVKVEGSVAMLLLINFFNAVAALSLGMVLSTLANSEFEMMQFIPLVIIPQIFLCGIFKLSDEWAFVGKFVPMTYSVEGLQEIIKNTSDFDVLLKDMIVLVTFSLIFIFLNFLLLVKKRRA